MAITASACSFGSHPGAVNTEKVLGAVRGTPLAVGQPAPGQTGQLGAVSCADALRCWAVGVPGPNATMPAGPATVVVATTNRGTSWSAQRVVGGYTPELAGIACPTKSDCIAVGSNGLSSGVVITTDDAGKHWLSATTPTGAVGMTSIECMGAAECMALVGNGNVTWSAQTTDFGETWTQEGDLPPSFVATGALTCTPAGPCLVAGYVPTTAGHGSGAIAVSHDGGQTWASASVPAGIGTLQSTVCLSVSVCLAGGSTSTTVSDVVPAAGQLLRSTDGGATWAAVPGTIPVDDVFGLACPTAELCAMVGTNWVGSPAVSSGAVAQSNDGGSSFKASRAAYAPLTLTALSCPTAAACVAVGGDSVVRVTLTTPRVSHRHNRANAPPQE
jgi:photosystem II stability/assembly factor-like uncharacterized protein